MQSNNKKLISIIVLNYNGGEIVMKCMESIKKQTYQNYEIILIDNDSKDDSIKKLKEKFKDIFFILNKKNFGYAGGNNTGIKKAKGKKILLLNNDIVLDKNFLKNLSKNDKDIVGVKNYYYGKKKIIWAVGAKLNKLLFRTFLVGMNKKDVGQYDKEYFPEQIPGSAMFIKKEVFDKIGYFNEDYFSYYEETEWQFRAKKAGFEIAFEPSAVLWHRVAYSSGGGSNPLSDYYLIRNRLYFIKKYQSSLLKPISYTAVFLEAFLKIINPLFKRRKNALFPLIGIRDFLNEQVGMKK